MDPNRYQQVKVITNPVKSVVLNATFSETETSAECRIYKELLDLSEGVWNVCFDCLIISNKSKTQKVQAIFDIKTDLCTNYKQIQQTAVTTIGWLANVEVRCEPLAFERHCATKSNYFMVTSRPTDHFNVYFVRNELTNFTKYRLKVEMRLLFQRVL